MKHALTIGAAGPAADTAINNLWDAGYHSIFRVDDVAEALPLLADLHPALILVLSDTGPEASAIELSQLSALGGAPVVVSRGNVKQSLGCLGPEVLSEAVGRARAKRSELRLAA